MSIRNTKNNYLNKTRKCLSTSDNVKKTRKVLIIDIKEFSKKINGRL